MIILHLLMGLPGSGKTYFANHYDSNNRVVVWTLDDSIINGIYDDLCHSVPTELRYNSLNLNSTTEVIVDGLFLTNKTIATAINKIFDYLDSRYRTSYKIIIHHWDNDKTRCLHNDKFRRYGTNASAIIKNANYDRPDITVIRNIIGSDYNEISISIEEHKVENIPLIERMISEYGETIMSPSWDTGGQWGNCWGNSGAVTPEEPLEFEELDRILEAVAPNITFLQYKRLKSNCVKLDSFTDYGYYGSYTYCNRWECDTQRLFEWLIDNNIINSND